MNIQSRINSFVRDRNQLSFQLKIDDTLFAWLFMSAIASGILMILVMSEATTCIFDRSSGYMTKKRHWLFLFTRTTRYPLLEIQYVQVEWTYHRSRVYRMSISLSSGKKLPLSTYYCNYLQSRDSIEVAANTLKNFLSWINLNSFPY